MKYTLINCRPVPESEAKWIQICLKESGATLNSALRTQSAVDYARARGCTLSSQAELYNGWIHHLPGYNPANPPGYSTHELRSDGVAYPSITRGLPIPRWAVGLDIDDAHVASFCAAARKHGWVVTVTYPGSPSEYHHVNARKEPKIHLPALKKGSKGVRVKSLTSKLALLRRPDHNGNTYLAWNDRTKVFDDKVQAAVREFQHDHHLTADGVVGVHTNQQLKASWRYYKKHKDDGKHHD